MRLGIGRKANAQVDGDRATEQLGEVGENDANLGHDIKRVEQPPVIHQLVPRIAVVQGEPAMRCEVCRIEAQSVRHVQQHPHEASALGQSTAPPGKRRHGERTVIGDASEPRRQDLEEEGDEAGKEDDEQVAVAELQTR